MGDKQQISLIGANHVATKLEHPAKLSAAERTRQKYARIIDSPELQELSFLEREFLQQRWLDQIIWFSNKAKLYRDWFYWVRVTTIIGSILVPALISLGSVYAHVLWLQFSGLNGTARSDQIPIEDRTFPSTATAFPGQIDGLDALFWYRFCLFSGLGLSQLVAILAAVDQLFKFGDRWRHYRSTAELLKMQGWQFFELSGPYITYAQTGHKEAFPAFANQIEEIIQSDVEGYVSQIASQKLFNRTEDISRR